MAKSYRDLRPFLSQVGHKAPRALYRAATFAAVLTWAITRAVDESRMLVDQLIGEGVRAVSLPCIERTVRALAPWKPEGHRVVLLTSVTAVEAVKPLLAIAMPLDVAVLSPTTREAFLVKTETRAVENASHPTITVESEEGVVALSHRILESLHARGITHAHFWYPTSSAGLEAQEQNEAIALLSRRGPVDRVIAYDVATPGSLIAQLREVPPQLGVVFSSPSAVRHFLGATRQLEQAPRVKLAACWGESTCRAASPYFPQTHLLSRTRPLAESLLALEKSHG